MRRYNLSQRWPALVWKLFSFFLWIALVLVSEIGLLFIEKIFILKYFWPTDDKFDYYWHGLKMNSDKKIEFLAIFCQTLKWPRIESVNLVFYHYTLLYFILFQSLIKSQILEKIFFLTKSIENIKITSVHICYFIPRSISYISRKFKTTFTTYNK